MTRVILGIAGGIAASKAPQLIRHLRDADCEVRCVMTAGAAAFITPLTLQALSGNPVHDDLLDPAAEAAMGHIELARWADKIIIAPATANLMARLAAGLADDLLTTLCLAAAAPVLLAPAMNQGMWRHPATRRNTATLRELGYELIGPATGNQACGDVGPGRMLEPVDIVAAALADPDTAVGELAGRRVVVTAGPTREAIDPVRYISNHSSGKQGFAIAAAAAAAGADVVLISGPAGLETPARVTRIDVESAREMLEAAMEHGRNADVFIGVAAVADYRPADVARDKLKKCNDDGMELRLVQNPDIVRSIAALPAAERPFTVGFAAETRDVLRYAERKLAAKGLDLIVANDVSDSSIGFNSDQNRTTVLWRDGRAELELADKRVLAGHLLDIIAARLKAGTKTDTRTDAKA